MIKKSFLNVALIYALSYSYVGAESSAVYSSSNDSPPIVKDSTLGPQAIHVEVRPHAKEPFDYIKETFDAVVAETVGFIFLAFILAGLTRKHIQEGLHFIGSTLVAAIIPQIILFRKDVSDAIKSKPFPSGYPEETSASPQVEGALNRVDELVKGKQYHVAYQTLVTLQQEHPFELKVLEKIVELSNTNEWNYPKKHLETLQILQVAESKFENDPKFFALLTMAYVDARLSGLWNQMKEGAINAAKKAWDLEDEIDKPRRKSLLGLVHYYFCDLPTALAITEEAFEDAEAYLKQHPESQTNSTLQEAIARIKNNLASYYAEKADENLKDKSLKMALEAKEYDERYNLSRLPDTLDTLGYVLMKFASTKEELLSAMTYLERARAAKPYDETFEAHYIACKAKLDALS